MCRRGSGLQVAVMSIVDGLVGEPGIHALRTRRASISGSSLLITNSTATLTLKFRLSCYCKVNSQGGFAVRDGSHLFPEA